MYVYGQLSAIQDLLLLLGVIADIQPVISFNVAMSLYLSDCHGGENGGK